LADYPQPFPGLVIRYAYLWKREADAGQIEGEKHRPCAIVVAVVQEAGEWVVTVAPITRQRPKHPDRAIELSAATRRRLGLGNQPNWIMATEVNSFYWPILLKNSVSTQGRRILGDMARLAHEVPRAYRPTAISLRESSQIASAKTCPQVSLSVPGRRKSACSGEPSFSTE